MKEEEIKKALTNLIRGIERRYPHLRDVLVKYVLDRDLLLGDLVVEPELINEFVKSEGYYIGIKPCLIYEDDFKPVVVYKHTILHIKESHRDDERPSSSVTHGNKEYNTEAEMYLAAYAIIFNHINERYTPEDFYL